MEEQEIKKVVRETYGRRAGQGSSCCGPPEARTEAEARPRAGSSEAAEIISREIGYSAEDLKAVPEGANLGLGCGNPIALASLKEGETVLDLGAGAGFDCFLAANMVGENGRVIGVDMTPEMIDRARENAGKGNYRNVEFRLGEIENIPAADASVDVVISNCVINLAPDKRRVFGEAFRVLKPGGRMMVSDIVLCKELPDFVRKSVEAYVGCIAGAVKKDEYLLSIRDAGFREVEVVDEASVSLECFLNDPSAEAMIEQMGLPREKLGEIGGLIASVKVQATKP